MGVRTPSCIHTSANALKNPLAVIVFLGFCHARLDRASMFIEGMDTRVRGYDQ
jgi:hypothetical protein